MTSTPMRERAIVRIGAVVVAALLGLAVLWLALGFVLKVTRGLDLTDEGLYLLAADPPNASAAWGFPFGWHTHPLYALVGYDIASFRTLGALILLLSSAWLGWLLARTLRTDGRLLPALTAVLAGIASLLYYVSMLRTPSYNWLCLVGIVLASSGLLLAVRQAGRDSTQGIWRQQLVPAAVASIALFITLPAKPSVLPMVLLLGLLLLLVLVGWAAAWRWLALAVVLMPVWVLLAVGTKVWPLDFASVLKRAFQMPSFDPGQTPKIALQEALLAPRDAAAVVGGLANGPALLLLAGAVALGIPLLLRRRWFGLRLIGFAAVTVDALGIAGVPIPTVNAGGKPFGLAQVTLTTALLPVLLATVAVVWRLNEPAAAGPGRRLTRAQASAVLAVFLVLLALVFGFGSDNGIYGQAALAGGLLLLAAGVVALGLESRRDALTVLLAVLIASVLFVGAGLVGGWRFPQRQAPLAEQTVTTQIGTHGAQLDLDPKTSQTLNELRASKGWTPGTPLVDVSYTWNPAVGYAIGAGVPESLMLTIYGYSGTHDVTAFHLRGPYLDFPFKDAWVLTTKPELLDAGARSAVDYTLSQLSAVSGRSFPAAFSCVASGDFILWQPLPEGQSASSRCGW